MKIAHILLSIVIGTFFFVFGILKTIPNVNENYHQRIKLEFGRYNKVFPFYAYTGFRPFARNYRTVVGLIEIAAGITLLTGRRTMRFLASLILTSTTALLIYSHFILGDVFQTYNILVIFAMLNLVYMFNFPSVVEYKSRRSNHYDSRPKND